MRFIDFKSWHLNMKKRHLIMTAFPEDTVSVYVQLVKNRIIYLLIKFINRDTISHIQRWINSARFSEVFWYLNLNLMAKLNIFSICEKKIILYFELRKKNSNQTLQQTSRSVLKYFLSWNIILVKVVIINSWILGISI